MSPERKLLKRAGVHDVSQFKNYYACLYGEIESQTPTVTCDPYDANCRYKDVLCPTKTRIQERDEKIALHANRVLLEGMTFIAMQYPRTSQHALFWRVARESSLIVDLSRESDQMTPYYPSNKKPVQYGDATVCRLTINRDENVQTANYSITLKDGTYKCLRIHFSTWKDQNGINTNHLDKLISMIESAIDFVKPVIIHCRAGIGRTGTVIVSIVLKKLILEKKVHAGNLESEIKRLILEGRKQRGTGFVQSAEQYETIHTWASHFIKEVNKLNRTDVIV